jgi:hypothetical protein
MSYDSRETSVYGGVPFELYWFASGTRNWYFTSGDTERTYLANLYVPETIDRTEQNQNQELNAGSITVTLPKGNPVATQFIGAIPSTPFSVVIFRGHDGESEVITNFTGRIANVQFDEDCVFTLAPEQYDLKKVIPPQTYQGQCNWILYSEGCGIDPNDFKYTGTVSAVSGDTITVPDFAALDDQFLTAGWIEKDDLRRMIIDQTGGVLTTITPMPGIEVGDSVTAFAGCMLFRTVCRDKFNNLDRFFGFDRIPSKNPFEVGVG